MKKAQLIGQPFVYLFALIVAALILLFGAKTILDLKAQAELTQLSTFVTELRNQISNYYNLDTGSSKDISIPLPSKVRQVCFTNPLSSITLPTSNITQIDPFLKYELDNNKKYHFYIIPLTKFSLSRFTVDHLEINPSENPLCFKTNGKLKATIETKVNRAKNYGYVEISR